MFRRIFILVGLLGLMGFGFSQFNTCTNISSPGSYTIDSSLIGNSSFGGVQACIYINISNVTLYCKEGVTLTGDKVAAATRGIHVVDTSNVTVMNCKYINSYGIGLSLDNVENSTFQNMTVNNSYSDGIKLNSARYNNMTNLTAFNSSAEGFHFVQALYNQLNNSFAYNNTKSGLFLEQGSDSNNISFTTSYLNGETGFREVDIELTIYLSNVAHNNTINGFWLFNSNGHLFNNNSAIQNEERGFYLQSLSNFNILGNNTALYNGVAKLLPGFQLTSSENNTLINNSATGNGGYGFYLLTANYNNLTFNSAFNNTEDGFRIRTSNSTLLANNTADYNQQEGYVLTTGSRYSVIFSNNATYNTQTGFGIYLNSTSNNLSYNFAEKNTGAGFIISNSNSNRLEWNRVSTSELDCFDLLNSSYLVLENNTAIGGQVGFFSNASHYQNYTNNSASYNGDDGFALINSSNNTLARNIAYGNTGEGFYFTDILTSGNTITGNTAYLNVQNGLRMSSSTSDTFTSSNFFYNNIMYRNFQNGFRIGDETYFNIMNNNTAFNNTLIGLLFSKAYYNNVSNTTLYGNGNYGLSIGGSTYILFRNTFIYNQSSYLNSPADTNFTNITFGYSSTTGLVNYQFINTSTTLQLLSSNFLLNPSWVSMDAASATAFDANRSANITITTDRCSLPIWRKLGFPVTLADIIANGSLYTPIWTVCLSGAVQFSVTSFSGYTTNDACVNLSNSATWTTRIVNDSSGILNVNENVTLCRDVYPLTNTGGGNRVLELNASNIFLDCNGSTINGVDGTDTGIYSGVHENIIIRNCLVTNYQSGFFLVSGSNRSTLLNNTAYTNSNRGFYLSTSHGNFLTNLTAYDNVNGFFITGSENNSIAGAISYNNTNGFVVGANRNNFTNSTSYNNDISGFSLISSSAFNLVEGSSSYKNVFYGFELNPAENNTIRTSVAYNNTYGFYINFSINNNFTNNTAYSNTQHGFFLLESNGSALLNNTAYNNTYGFYANSSNYSVFTNNIARNNSQTGFELREESTYSNITGSSAFGNTKYGFYLTGASGNNRVQNSVAYNNADSGFFSDASSNNLFNNLTSYRNKNGVSMNNGENLTVANSTAYGNLIYPGAGFLLLGVINATATNNTAYNDSYGFIFMYANYSNLQRNVAYNATDGIYMYYVNATVASNNTAYNNANYGFDILSSSLNNFTDSAAYANAIHGFYLSSSNNNSFLNTVSYANGPAYAGHGFFTDTSNNNTFRNTLLYANGMYGFDIYASADNAFFNTTAYSNGIQGIQLWDQFFTANSSGNNFTDTLLYNNSAYGIYVLTPAWNQFANTFIYNQTAYLSVGSTEQTNFTNLTLGYTSIIGLVNFLPVLNLTSVDLYTQDPLSSSSIILRDYWVSLNDASALQVNTSANITVYTQNCTYPVKRLAGFPTSLGDILENGSIYSTSVTCDNSTLIATFNVSGFSGYALGVLPTFLTMTVSPNTTLTYPAETNVSCTANNAEVNITIYRNGTLVQSGFSIVEDLVNLSAGSYNYTCNTSGSENYTAATTSSLLTINMNTTVLTFSVPASPVIGSRTNVTCAASNSAVNLTLYRNGVEIANGTSEIYDDNGGVPLPAGTYIYICNTTGDENYTGATAYGTMRFISSPTGGGAGAQCYLEGVVNSTVPVGTEVPIQIFRYSDADSTRTSLFGANVNIIHGETVVSYTTDTQGYVHYTPESAGTYTYAASFGDCSDTDGTFRAVEQPVTLGFVQGCDSIISLYYEVCEEQPTADPTMGAIACRQVPVPGETVEVYNCKGEDCTELLGNFTTDSEGEVRIHYRDGNIKIVVPASGLHGEIVDYQQLLPSSVCGEPTITVINFDPGCPSTITVMQEGCREVQQDLTGAQRLALCSGRPAEGVQVEVYRCSEPYMAEAGIECDLIGTYTTNSEGQATTDAVDGYIRIVATGEDGVPYETSGTLPSGQDCQECTSDSDCGQGELCRGGQCVPRDQLPPEERPCSAASDCPTGYNCGTSGLCTQQPVQECVRDDQCAAGFLCRDSACVDERTVIGGGGVEGGGIAGLLGNIINAVQKSFVFIVLLLALLLLLWFFFWRKKRKQRAKGAEELIAAEEERGRPRRK